MSVLEVDRISVRFGGHLAVSDASLRVEGGRVSGLIGPNGAGKTTTFNAICGVVQPTSGQVLLDGRNDSDHKGLDVSPFGKMEAEECERDRPARRRRERRPVPRGGERYQQNGYAAPAADPRDQRQREF